MPAGSNFILKAVLAGVAKCRGAAVFTCRPQLYHFPPVVAETCTRSYSGGAPVTRGGVALLNRALNLKTCTCFFMLITLCYEVCCKSQAPSLVLKQLLKSDLNGSVLLSVLLLSQPLSCPVAYLCVYASVCDMLHRLVVMTNVRGRVISPHWVLRTLEMVAEECKTY